MATNTHSQYVTVILFPQQQGYANAPQHYVTPTLPFPKYTNDRSSLERSRKSMDILKSDQVTGRYLNTLQLSQEFSSLLPSSQSVEQNFISFN
jgi:hypothetical protein